MAEKKNDFVKQAGILAMAGIISRIIGILYRSPIAAIIGDEGNGYYGAAYNIYAIILLISSYSIPSAISKVIAGKLAIKEYKNAHRIFHCAFIYVIIIGGIASFVAFFGAEWFVTKNAATVLQIFAPTIFLSGILGVLRGYFQAHKTMLQTSVSQILEQIMNAVVSILAAYLLKQAVSSQDATTQAIRGAMGSALGTGMGVVIALIFMGYLYYLNRDFILKRVKRDKHKEEMSYLEIFKVIFTLVTPFILSTFIYNFNTSLDQTIYMKILENVKGFDNVVLSSWYGVYSGKSVVITNIPVAIASAMAAAMIPSISGKISLGDTKGARSKVHTAILTTMIIAIPAAVGIAVLSKPVVSFLFPNQTSLDLAAKLLTALSLTVVFYSLSTLTNAVLQAIGKINIPVINAFIALVIQTIILVVCLMFTDLNLYSLVIATNVYALVMCILNAISIRKYLGYRDKVFKVFVLPAISSVVMGIVSYFTYKGLIAIVPINQVVLPISIAIGGLIYLISIIKLGVITERDLKSMPKGTKLIRGLKKIHLL